MDRHKNCNKACTNCNDSFTQENRKKAEIGKGAFDKNWGRDAKNQIIGAP